MIRKYKTPAGGKQILATYDLLLQAWDVPVQEEDVATTFGQTHLVEAGDPQGEPLLLFHGVGDDAAFMWRYNAKALARHFRLIAVDTIGGPGKSEPNERYFTDFEQVRWIDDILDAKAIGQAHLAGVSNGAYLVQCYTANRPLRVGRAVCMAGGLAVQGQRGALLKMLKIFLPEALFPNEKNARRLAAKLTANPDVLISDSLNMQHWLALLKHFNNRAMMAHKITGFADDQIAIIRDKTRFLIGIADRLAYSPESLALLDRYQIDYRIVEQAGHAINHEQPEIIHQEIIRHLLAH